MLEGPGHGSEKRINLSTSELCSEAPTMRTVSVHVMWDAQEKITPRPESICRMQRTARGASYGGETLCVARSARTAEASRHPLRLFPGTFTGHPPYSVRKVRDLGFPFSLSIMGFLVFLGRVVSSGHVGCCFSVILMPAKTRTFECMF